MFYLKIDPMSGVRGFSILESNAYSQGPKSCSQPVLCTQDTLNWKDELMKKSCQFVCLVYKKKVLIKKCSNVDISHFLKILFGVVLLVRIIFILKFFPYLYTLQYMYDAPLPKKKNNCRNNKSNLIFKNLFDNMCWHR